MYEVRQRGNSQGFLPKMIKSCVKLKLTQSLRLSRENLKFDRSACLRKYGVY